MTTSRKAPKLPAGELPQGELLHLFVDSLRLDPENPRLPESTKPRGQDELVKLLANDYSLKELGRSLADNGFFSEEPLAAIRDSESRKGEYIVIEGNRRLAALKLLNEPALRNRLKLDEWSEIAAKKRFDLTKVPVIAYHEREELLTFMGFRHITGVKPWEPLAKARFIHSLIDEHGMDFQQAARRVGSKPNAIRQHYMAYRVYLQARDQFSIDVAGLENAYGVFTRAMSSAPLKKYIGITSAKEETERPTALATPVPKARAENLKEFVSWIAGSEDRPAVISDSREITTLGEVVAAPQALSILRMSRNLESAKQLTGGEETRLLQHLLKASYHLDEALKDAHRHKRSSRVSSALQRCDETISELRKALT
jgi:ParB-like nuclease family protein